MIYISLTLCIVISAFYWSLRYLLTHGVIIRRYLNSIAAYLFERLPKSSKGALLFPMRLAGYSQEYVQLRTTLLVLCFFLLAPLNFFLMNPFFFVASAIVLLWLLKPFLNASRKAKSRRKEAVYQLPHVLDGLALLSIAGFPIATALQRVLRDIRSGPLTEELKLAMSRLKTGYSYSQAIESVYLTLPCPQIRIFINLLKQSALQGSGVHALMTEQSRINRENIEFEIEKVAQETPVRLLAPLALLIFPATLLPFVGLIWVKMQ
ncbi:type II secretion system F family protein [Aliidiomarina sp. B3213]|uniref:type II secretion system F family protein n=1 Tax=Aliidiomarina sp. B3213 TaxID=2249757 RepID=UPI000F809564|nr:type II secretion system F family protein [Aliidiomarina sp. B3213]RTE87401.1 hypothetical protein DQX04_03170 [Aliidiomarina sp. B3213]